MSRSNVTPASPCKTAAIPPINRKSTPAPDNFESILAGSKSPILREFAPPALRKANRPGDVRQTLSRGALQCPLEQRVGFGVGISERYTDLETRGSDKALGEIGGRHLRSCFDPADRRSRNAGAPGKFRLGEPGSFARFANKRGDRHDASTLQYMHLRHFNVREEEFPSYAGRGVGAASESRRLARESCLESAQVVSSDALRRHGALRSGRRRDAAERRSVVRFRSAESFVRALERGSVLADSRLVVRICLEMSDFDQRVRAAAFAAMEKLCLQEGGRVTWEAISAGFEIDGQKILFANRARGIFKPRQLEAALSIKTTVPRQGRRPWYQDQVSDDESWQDYAGLLRYELARGELGDPTNRALWNASERKLPLIYFAGVAPGVYQPVFPVWIEDFRPEGGYVLVATADFERHGKSSVAASLAALPSEIEATYSLSLTRNRNHQAWFSMRTKAAYGWRCAFSGLPVRELLVGAHIVPDSEGGLAAVRNGICMSTLHHNAFDANLLGVDPDFRIHVSPKLRDRNDGDLLVSLKGLDGSKLRLPAEPADRPARELLERRFAGFQA